MPRDGARPGAGLEPKKPRGRPRKSLEEHERDGTKPQWGRSRKKDEPVGGPAERLRAKIGPEPRLFPGEVEPGEHFARFCALANITQGPRELRGKPLVLEPYLREFVDEALAIDEHGRRIWKRAGLIIPRKNAKTTAAAALSLYFVSPADGEHRPVVIHAAGSREQADEVWKHTQAFVIDERYGSDFLKTIFEVKKLSIVSPGNAGFIKKVAAVGGLNMGGNAHLIIADELHVWVTKGQMQNWDALTTAGGGRDDPMILFLTTAGDEEHGPLWDMLATIREGGANEIEKRGRCHTIFRNREARMLVYEYAVPTGTPLDDLDVWKEANPASWRTKDRLAEDLADPFIDESTKRRLYGNEWTGAKHRWIDDVHWEAARSDEEIPEGEEIVCGVDAAHSFDMTALAWAWLREDGVTIIRTRVWSARDDRDAQGAYDVYVPMSPPRLDNDLVSDYIVNNLAKRYACRLVFYDPAYFDTQSNDLSELGYIAVEMKQNMPAMRVATNEFHGALYGGAGPGLLHNGDPVLYRHVRAAVGFKVADGWKFQKVDKHSPRPVDAVSASVMARFGAVHHSDYIKPRPRIMVL